jgi:Tfp pilus assembly protein PilO
MNWDSKKQEIGIWAENHKKSIVLGMVLVLFISFLILIVGFFNEKKPQKDTMKKLKEATEKVGKTTKTNFNQTVNVNEMYKNASQLMQKDSLTKEDSIYLIMVDSTFKSIMKQR